MPGSLLRGWSPVEPFCCWLSVLPIRGRPPCDATLSTEDCRPSATPAGLLSGALASIAPLAHTIYSRAGGVETVSLVQHRTRARRLLWSRCTCLHLRVRGCASTGLPCGPAIDIAQRYRHCHLTVSIHWHHPHAPGTCAAPMTQVLSQPPALPRMGDRLFLAGASPYSKVTAAAKRKREYRDAGFRGGCQTCEASSKRAPDAQAAPEVGCAEAVHALGRLQAAGGARTSGLTGVPGGRPPPAGLAASSITCCMAQRRSWSAARQPAAPARARARWSAPRAGCAA